MSSPSSARARFWAVIGGLSAAVMLAWALSASVGVERVDWRAVFTTDGADRAIGVDARLGRALLGSVVGAALGAMLTVYRLGLVRGRLVPYVALLAGVVLNALSWALILTIATVARVGTTAEVLVWLMGSLGPPRWWSLGIGAAVVVACVAALT